MLITRTTGRREKTRTLRRALLESGVKESCATCQLGPRWNDRKLTLQINHRNGNNIDDSPENLEFLCPNCHTQTVTFAARKR